MMTAAKKRASRAVQTKQTELEGSRASPYEEQKRLPTLLWLVCGLQWLCVV